jgi:hypothetical protein
VRLREANKRARVAIRLTSDRLAAAVRAERGPAMTGDETATVRPPQLGFRANAGAARPSSVLGARVGTREELGVTGLTRQQAEQQCRRRR